MRRSIDSKAHAGKNALCGACTSPQQEEERGVDEEEEGNTRGEKACNGVIDVEMIELCRGDGVDGARRDGEDEDGAEENGIADERIGDCKHKCGENEKAQGEEVERVGRIAACAVKIYERTDGEHAKPCTEVDESLKCCADCRRPINAKRVEYESCRHAKDAELVP